MIVEVDMPGAVFVLLFLSEANKMGTHGEERQHIHEVFPMAI
jgi:hypothetical protein